jgi:isoquinoline 1-oxidoreductase subunit alpha
MKITVNGQSIEVTADPSTPLLWILRAELKLTGTKYGCGRGLCGACTVLIDNQAVRSCVMPLETAVGRGITTIEGLSGAHAEALRRAWKDIDVVQCGYCQSGQLMSAAALLKANAPLDDRAIDAAMSGNLCRCGTYPRIRAAIHAAARELASNHS